MNGAANGSGAPPSSGLRYVQDDGRPGYRRRKLRSGFVYFDTANKRIDDPNDIARINSLAIPPAYTDVWICPDPRGHLQATGRDARGRKQYRYHPLWRETRDAEKYERLAAFGRTLPRIRAQVTRDLKLHGMPREKVVAAIVRLLDTTLVRIGSTEYVRDNDSYGLTTLRKKHVKVKSGEVRLRFTGKSGIEHDVTVDDPRVVRIVRRCADLPGYDLFQYLDDDGERHTVGSADVNDYLHRASGADFTAKDYRTWAGSVFALAALRQLDWHGATSAKSHIVATVKEVATLLRNTPAVCRKCYIHPRVITAFEAGELEALPPAPPRRGLRVDEAALAALLAKRPKRVRSLTATLAASSREAKRRRVSDAVADASTNAAPDASVNAVTANAAKKAAKAAATSRATNAMPNGAKTAAKKPAASAPTGKQAKRAVKKSAKPTDNNVPQKAAKALADKIAKPAANLAATASDRDIKRDVRREARDLIATEARKATRGKSGSGSGRPVGSSSSKLAGNNSGKLAGNSSGHLARSTRNGANGSKGNNGANNIKRTKGAERTKSIERTRSKAARNGAAQAS